MAFENKNVLGDTVPSAADLVLMITGKSDTEAEAFQDISAWEINSDGSVGVLYKSGREEVYRFTADLVSAGIYFGV